MFKKDFITLVDLYIAYRKAKSDAFYDALHPNALAFTEYESSLKLNLSKLLETLHNKGVEWPKDLDFIGSHLYIPKSIDESPWNSTEELHYREVNPANDWKQRFSVSKKKKLEAKYRLLISPTVDYQIISALWIIKVGHLFEWKLDTNISYGNRLRRESSESVPFKETFGNDIPKRLNFNCLGLFSPYFSAYQQWRNKGLEVMRTSVESGKNVTAITLDLAGFYHNIAPRFILKPSFLKEISVDLSSDERKFTNLLLDSIDFWYSQSLDAKSRPEGALPIGLSASRIISNVLLYQFDNEIQMGLKPLYYGRYVDDFFIVVETPDTVDSATSLLRWMEKSIPSLKLRRSKGKELELYLKFKYSQGSNLFFTASKQKIFHLTSEHGLDLINQISSQIKAQSSEYRLLPEVPETASKMASSSLLATSDATLSADALRKADSVSVRRLGFALLIRDIESYSKDLPRSEWEDIRQEFYKLAYRHLITPKGFFNLSVYYSRIFRLMVSNHDFKNAEDFVIALKSCIDLIASTTISNKEENQKLTLCRSYFEKTFLQAAIQASTTRKFTEWTKLGRLLRVLFTLNGGHYQPNIAPYLKKQSKQVLLADWGSRPYKDYWYYSQNEDIRDAQIPRSVEVQKVINWLKIKDFRIAADLKNPHWPALVFPTRPLSIQEIALIAPKVIGDENLFKASILGLRGAKVGSFYKLGFKEIKSDRYLSVPNNKKSSIKVALTNVLTTKEQWENAAKGTSDRSIKRYENINSLINRVLKEKDKPDYIVFPECSLPRRWAITISSRLAKEGISMLAGLEYYPHKKNANELRNDTLVSLATRWPGYRSNLIYMQPKLHPSHGENQALKDIKKSQYIPPYGIDELPIYNHGGYFFGLINCSDLTAPMNRVKYQGKVDGLFVLEWNPDVKTFNFLVEGAAHDVHTFVIQVNNRAYGDSRIRVPYRLEFMRDPIRIKGGVTDFYVLGNMDYEALRMHHKRTNMAIKGDFKPTPIGFKMSEFRRKNKVKI